MDYINYVKQKPFTGITGFGGGATGLQFQSAGAKFVTGGTRGAWGGGNPHEMPGPGPKYRVIDYIQIATTGNASSFGDLTAQKFGIAGASNQTRGVYIAGGKPGSPTISNVMDYITFSSIGNATDFGDTFERIYSRAGCSDGSEGNRGLYWGGYPTPSGTLTNKIGYINISSTGNSQDFGDTTDNTGSGQAWADSTRGCFNGSTPGRLGTNVIQYVTIQSTGNSQDFGDMVESRRNRAGTADATRGVISNGEGPSNAIDYVTIATTGNASDFGNSTISTNGRSGSNSKTRSVWGGGEDNSGSGGNPNQVGYDVIDYVTTQTTGNASDFGNLTIGRRQTPGCVAGNN